MQKNNFPEINHQKMRNFYIFLFGEKSVTKYLEVENRLDVRDIFTSVYLSRELVELVL